MVIDTSTISGLENSLAAYLDVSVDDLYDYIEYASIKAKNGFCFNDDVFNDTLIDIISDLQPMHIIDEVYVYHLTRRLNSTLEDLSSLNLKELLTTSNAFSNFLKEHNVTFVENNGLLNMYYNNTLVDLENCNKFSKEIDFFYLRSRLGYNVDIYQDFCFNGFMFRNSLMKNNYTRSLYFGPEIITHISNYLDDNSIKTDYFNNSSYYCYTYKFKLEDIILDDFEKFNESEKLNKIIVQSCYELLQHKNIPSSQIYDHNNLIVRLRDNDSAKAEELILKEIITSDMIQ